MKAIRICTFLLFVPFFAFSIKAKEEKDSVNAKRRVDSLDILVNYYYQKENFQKVLEYDLMIADINNQWGNSENTATSYNNIVGVFIRIKEYELAEEYLQNMIRIVNKIPDPVIKGRTFSNQAQIDLGHGNIDQALRNLYNSIFYFQKGKAVWLEARAYRLLGDAFMQKKQYSKALHTYKISTMLFQQKTDDFEIAVNYTRMASIFQLLNECGSNLNYNLKALHIREMKGSSKMIASSYINVGEAFWLINQKDSAKKYLEKALKLALPDKNNYLLKIIYRMLSDFAKKEKKFKEAMMYFTESVKYSQKFRQEQNDAEIAMMVTNHNIRSAEANNKLLIQENEIKYLLLHKHRYQTIIYEIAFLSLMALVLFINMLAVKSRNRKNKLQVLNEQLQAEIHERIEAEGRLHRSEEMHRFLADNSADVISLLDANMRRLYISPSCEKLYGYPQHEILRMNTPLDLVEPSHRVTVNYRFLELFRTKKSSQYRYKALRKDGSWLWAESNINPILDPGSGEIKEMITVVRDISEQMKHEEELSENARQKEYLLREIHNRVKNNFAILVSLMTMQRNQPHNSELNSSITDLQLRLRTMSLVHEQLYHNQDISHIPFDDYLRHLTLIISSSFKNDLIRLKTDIRSCQLSIEMALPLGLIVNELMTNSYKYAFPWNRTGTVWVILIPEDEEKYTISICDDGIGLPDDFNIKNSQSMGMQIVQILVEQIEASLEFSGKNGACFNILFSTSQEK